MPRVGLDARSKSRGGEAPANPALPDDRLDLPATARGRLLFVGDEEAAQALAAILSQQRFEVVRVGSSREALDALRNADFAALIADADSPRVADLPSLLASATDLAALVARARDAENRYRSLVDNSVDGMYQCGPDGRFL